jgi:uncharacterized protein YprB with RNaseH-like and TPR domain
VSLKRRLERLEPARSGRVEAEQWQEAERAPVVDRTLDDLRSQMQALLARSEPTRARTLIEGRPSRARVTLESLPFVACPTSHGPLWQRLELLDAAHHVGRVPVELVTRADPAVLADLALDPAILHASRERWLFLDTETTGLGGAGTLAFLVGMAGLDAAGGVVVEQLLLHEPAAERAVLDRIAERIQAASLIISFNGKAFDRPLLEGRYVMNRRPPLPKRPHLDLLHVGRRLHQRRLQRCTLKRVESEVLGFEREGDIDGSEIAPMYGQFLRSGDASGIASVVTHNFWDVVSMVALVGLYGQRSPALVGQDLAGLARTLKRAGATQHAERAAQAACEQGGGIDALRVRAELAKSRGDWSSALRDLERLCQEVDDPGGRLELAKLYEHGLRRPSRALQWMVLGTSEDSSAHARRRERLERKIRRNPAL